MMRRHPGAAPRISSMSEGTGQPAAITDITAPKRCDIGPRASGPGRSKAATYSFISITTRKVPRLPMPLRCAGCWIDGARRLGVQRDTLDKEQFRLARINSGGSQQVF